MTDHLEALIMEYLRNDPRDVAINKALHDIQAILKQHGQVCASHGLPSPTGNPF